MGSAGLASKTFMTLALVVMTATALLLFPLAKAHACGNAVMIAQDDAIKELREAEAALDEGDVKTARELAYKVIGRNRFLATREGSTPIYERALRIAALSYVRDPAATPGAIERAVDILDQRVKEMQVAPDPALAADYGETLERAHRDDEALNILRPLAERDLIGSAYAYAALSRAAGRKNEITLSASSSAKCRAMTGGGGGGGASARVCNGVYPSPPLLRGKPLGYALPGGVFLVAAAMLARARLGKRRKASVSSVASNSPSPPWATYRARFYGGLILVAGLAAFLNARSEWFAASLALITVLVVPFWQRRAFLSNARLGRVPGFHIRPASEMGVGDENAPLLRLFFGPSTPETLERLVDPSYRESARSPVLRLGRRPIRPLWILAIVLAGLFVGCTTSMMFLSRGASSFVPEE